VMVSSSKKCIYFKKCMSMFIMCSILATNLQGVRKVWNQWECYYFFIYRLKLKVKRLKMALTLDERMERVLLSGRQG
jgi:hypothetical protein